MTGAFNLLCRYRAALQQLRNLEFELAQARKQRKRKSAEILIDFLHEAEKAVLTIETEIDAFIKTGKDQKP